MACWSKDSEPEQPLSVTVTPCRAPLVLQGTCPMIHPSICIGKLLSFQWNVIAESAPSSPVHVQHNALAGSRPHRCTYNQPPLSRPVARVAGNGMCYWLMNHELDRSLNITISIFLIRNKRINREETASMPKPDCGCFSMCVVEVRPANLRMRTSHLVTSSRSKHGRASQGHACLAVHTAPAAQKPETPRTNGG